MPWCTLHFAKNVGVLGRLRGTHTWGMACPWHLVKCKWFAGTKSSRLQETPSHLQLLRDLGLPITMSSEQLALNLSGSLAAHSSQAGHPYAFSSSSMSSAEQLAHLWPSGPLKGSL